MPLLLAARHVESYIPDSGSNLHHLHWEHRVPVTGPPGKSLWILDVMLGRELNM